MSRELQPPVPISLVKIELPTVIKNEPRESEIVEIGIDDILDSSESEEIIPDVKEIDIVYHPICEDSIKSEILESKHCQSVEKRVLVKAEDSPFIKTENITTKDTSNENVTKGTGQAVVEIQASNEHSNAFSNLEIDEQSVLNFSKDLNIISVRSRKSKSPKRTDFAECCKTDETTLWKKGKEKIKVIKAPVIPVEAHEYTSLANDRHVCNHCQQTSKKLKYLKLHIKGMHREVTTMYQCTYCPYKSKWKSIIPHHIIRKHKDIKDIQWFQCNSCKTKFKLKKCLTEHMKVHLKHKQMQDGLDLREKRYYCEKCTYTSKISSHFKLHQLIHKTKAEIDDRLLKYRCDKCKYKTFRHQDFKKHKLIHLKPEEIQYFYCYHCSYKCKQRGYLKNHIFRHFKNEDVPFHCYICDFVTLKRVLIIEHFKAHPKHHSKCGETEYKYHLEIFNKRYCCEKCTYTSGQSSNLKLHQLTHKTKAEIDDRLLNYRCDKCKYKTFRHENFKKHKLIHLKPEEIQLKYRCDKCKYKTFRHHDFKRHKLIHLKQEEIQYFYCCHCSYKCNLKNNLKTHIFRHFKNEDVPLHCYICDFVTLKRDLITEHIKTHPKHHSK